MDRNKDINWDIPFAEYPEWLKKRDKKPDSELYQKTIDCYEYMQRMKIGYGYIKNKDEI